MTRQRFESATLESEISMSIAATDDTREHHRYNDISLRRRFSIVPHEDQLSEVASSKRWFGVNAEPVLFLTSIAIGVLTTLQPLVLYWARCVEIYGNPNNTANVALLAYENVPEFCSSLSDENHTIYQDVVEKDISTKKIYLQMAMGIPSLIVAPIMGAWSDGRGGRRKPLWVCLTGMTIYASLQLAATMSYSSMNIYYILFTAETLMGSVGGVAALFTSTYAMVTDDSRHKMVPGSSEVPTRIAVASAVQAVGQLIGGLLVSLLTVSAKVSVVGHTNGYIHSAIVGVIFTFAALMYGLIAVRETHDRGHARTQFADDCPDFESVDVRRSGNIKIFKAFVYDIVEVIIKPRPGWTRFCLNLSAVTIFAEFLALNNQLLFLLVKRYPFQWSDDLFIYYSLAIACILTAGMMIVPAFVSKLDILGKDSVLIMIGIAAGSFHFFTISFANSTNIIFLASVGLFFAGAIGPGYRSFLPRMVAKEETARLYTIFSTVMTICPILSSLIFNNIYNLTIDFWPAFVFFICGIIQSLVFCVQVIIHLLMRPLWIAERFSRAKLLDDSSSEDTRTSGMLGNHSDRSVSNTAFPSDADSEEVSDDLRPIII